VVLSTWTAPDLAIHEVAVWRPMSSAWSETALIDRVYVVPGSGCAGLAPILPHYFEGLQAREFVVLHKRHAQASAWPPPRHCPKEFIEHDHLPGWLKAWQAFLHEDIAQRPVPGHRLLLVGISEGAELLPALMQHTPAPGLTVLLGSPGLDPWEALTMQLDREHDTAFLGQLQSVLDAPSLAAVPADLGGRTLRYWRTLKPWPVARPLQDSDARVLVLMGAQDARQAPAALAAFNRRHLRPGICSVQVEGADHGLQVDGRQWPGLWPLVTQLMTSPTGQAFDQACTRSGGVISSQRSRP
jgi:hypothetical protein